jgi:hypothetical protein
MILKELYEKLKELCDNGNTDAFSISPQYMAAPRNEMLFDGVDIYVRSKDDGKIEVEGVVHYWHPDEGGSRKRTVIRTFGNIQDCLQWLKNEQYAASNECADILAERC